MLQVSSFTKLTTRSNADPWSLKLAAFPPLKVTSNRSRPDRSQSACRPLVLVTACSSRLFVSRPCP